MSVPYVFGTATAAIPLSQLDSNFNTTITLGNTAIQLGNTVTTLNNMTLANVTVTSGTSNLTSTTISNGTSNVAVASSGGNINLTTAGTTAVTVDTSQNVGIGMTPTNFGNGYTVLQVANATNGGMLYLTNTSNAGGRIYGNGAGITYDAFSTTYHAFNTNSAEAMRIDSSGVLLINTTSPIINSGNERMAIYQPSATSWANAIQIGNTGNATLYTNISGTANYTAISFRNNGNTFSICGSITVSGSTTSYITTSDKRLKENIQDAESASSFIDALRVRQFDWKTDNTHQRYGFIAQELLTVAPEAVHQPTNEEDAMGVDYSKLIPMLVKEIQSLRTRLTALENK